VEAKIRIKMLKEQIRHLPELCMERAELMTESYKETEADPYPIKRSKALKKILTEGTIQIHDGELIVGNASSKRMGGPMLPEVEWRWYIAEFFDEHGRSEGEKVASLSDEEKEKISSILGWWEGRSVGDKFLALVPEDYMEVQGLAWERAGANPLDGKHMSHCIPGWERVICGGVNGLLEQVERQLATLDRTGPEYPKRKVYLEAMKMSLESVIVYAQRYAVFAAEMAAAEPDPGRKAELEKIAEICRKVPEHPAETFYEAMQSLWFIYLAVMLEGYGPGIGFGRMDQFLWPFYKNDIEAGRITRDQARELIATFYVKINEMLMPQPVTSTGKSGGQGSITLSTVALGGFTPGSTQNLAEELTDVFLDAEEDVMLCEDISFRIYSTISDALLMKVARLAILVKGKIKFVGDEVAILQMLNAGKTVDDARKYAVTACFLHTIPGISHDVGADFWNPLMMLELALNNGVTRLSGKKIGIETGDPRQFKTYEELWNAFKAQNEYLLPRSIEAINLYMELFGEIVPSPLQSTLYEGCIEKGKDVVEGGATYSTINLWCGGIPSVGDSLAAIKWAVFDEKRLTMEQVVNALDKNFEGEDEVLFVLQSAPKYGNNNDYADLIVNDVLEYMCDQMDQYTAPYGRKYTLAGSGVTSNVSLGKVTGATPDGRKAGEPYSEGGMSPFQGRNISGATSTVMSTVKQNFARVIGGSVVNMKFNPDSLEEEEKIWKFALLLKTYCMLGGDILQFNIVSNEMLRDAQEHPEDYRDLLVRVATYSAYFVGLPKTVQDEIISRTCIEGV
jgi:formate C-acetyltransferase